ncbi:MAG: tetratricopeptide repeat protein [Gammaproteobacteria bacterium]|jgi:predicted negative regulator of RcsB-dependent stress response
METEDEQVEKLKSWLRENGMSIVFGIIIGVGGIVGYNYWQKYQNATAAEASDHFQALLEALDSGDRESVQQQADILVADYGSTQYAQMARLALAKSAVENGDFEAAGAALQEVVGSAGDSPLAFVARTRLAEVQIQQGQYDEALTTLSMQFPDAFAARADELRGDAHALKGQVAEAAEAYRRAQQGEPGPANPEFLKQKLDDLGAPS